VAPLEESGDTHDKADHKRDKAWSVISSRAGLRADDAQHLYGA
jgi:hypothetical protein